MARRFRPLRFLLTLGLVGFFALLLYQFGLFVMVLWLSLKNPTSSAFMDATKRALRQQNTKTSLQWEWIDYDDINTNLKRAVIASEDARFTSHKGVEWEDIKKAWQFNRQQAAQGSSRRRGGSTITQQLAKNMFLSSSRSYLRKAQELILAYMIELVMSKRRILELYLNVAQWGRTTFGAQAAAQLYYKQSARNLNAQQAAHLASMLPNPIYYEQHRQTPYLQRRRARIMHDMPLVHTP